MNQAANMKLTFLTEEWSQSNKDGFSILIRQLAIELSKLENVEIGILIPNASTQDKEDTKKYNIKVFEPENLTGFEPVDCLQYPPEGFSTDFIIGVGYKLGRYGAAIRKKFHCQWIHFVVRNAEEEAMFQNYPEAISEGQKEHTVEVELCEKADLVVTVGHKLNESFKSALRHCKKEILNLIPGIFEEFIDENQEFRDSKRFEILVFGRGNTEDFELKGLHVAAEAVAQLNAEHDLTTYTLKVVGAPEGKQEKLAEKLKSHMILPSQLIVRSFYKERRKLAQLFSEVDLVLMPSGTEAFGLSALEALSAGVPILVTHNSGLAEALEKVPFGSTCIVDSNANWADAIKKVWKNLKTRFQEVDMLRNKYKAEYSWNVQCAALVEKLKSMCPELENKCDSQDERDSSPLPLKQPKVHFDQEETKKDDHRKMELKVVSSGHSPSTSGKDRAESATGDEDGIPLINHKRLTGVGRTNHVQKGQTRREMPDEAPSANTSQAIGKVTKFVVGADWESPTEQLDFYFLANGIKEPKTMKAVLLTKLPVET
ncbi:uncharacterized protein LOC111347681 [Stylophora pistillata]|uniref:uncharacterized protein LOC111347681 n=1 Tax=Stylophora pistillata TaxID=50429 RepID=UPI000C0448C6|nr:uncharacterized protein LOC111347681 [Stylophora pistillata]